MHRYTGVSNFSFLSFPHTLLSTFCGSNSMRSRQESAIPSEVGFPNASKLSRKNLTNTIHFLYSGTDSRVGFGFRLGEHADFQVQLELGPQRETRPIGEL